MVQVGHKKNTFGSAKGKIQNNTIYNTGSIGLP